MKLFGAPAPPNFVSDIIWNVRLGLQEKLETREQLKIDLFCSSTRDRFEKEWAEYKHII
jgi:hypothetical protein